MSIVRVALDEKNSEAVAHLARQTGKTADQVVNEAVERFALASDEDEQEKFARWRAALLGIQGMWKHRDDLPDFAELRKSWDRNVSTG